MSGVCAIARNGDRPTDEQLLADMLTVMQNRGPDAQSYWTDGPIALGHTLLKTTYESEAEKQPSSLDGQVWITADVRIDDRTNLIAKLVSMGRNIDPATSDDQLILHAYAIWGTNCLDYMIGDFGFAIWDGHKKQLFCATDHFGVVPIFFGTAADDFVFSNSLNCIRQHSGISNALNEQAIGDNILFRMNNNPHSTSFADIQKLPAAHRLVWINGKISVSRYWAYEQASHRRTNMPEHLEEFDAILRNAVADRLRCDRAGTHVSGGMDSTSVAAILAEQKTRNATSADIRGHTMVVGDHTLALEQPFAEKVASNLNIPLQLHQGSEDDFLGDPALESAGDVSPEPGLLRRHSVRRDISIDVARYSRVLFTGFGGDPLLSSDRGYWDRQFAAKKWGEVASDTVRHFSIHGARPPGLFRFARKAKEKSPTRASRLDIVNWLNEDFVRRNDMRQRMEQRRQAVAGELDDRVSMSTDALWRRLFEWNDPGFSGVAVKVRHPFFDLRLLKWASATPPFPWLHRKYILREAMRHRLPVEVLNRAKTPIPGDKRRTLMGRPEFKAQLIDLLNEPALEQFVDRQSVLEGFLSGEGDTAMIAKATIRIKSLAIWLRYSKNSKVIQVGNEKRGLEGYVRRT